MPQISTTTSIPTGYTIATMQAAVNALIVAMQAGKTIYASDIAALNSSVYDLWRNHQHDATDMAGIDTFGNLTVYGAGGTSATDTTSATNPAYGAVTTPVGIAANSPITAADINVLINMVNNMRTHFHSIDDTIGATASVVDIANQTYEVTNYSPTSIALAFQNDGNEVVIGGGSPATGYGWIDMKPVDIVTAAQYDIYVSQSSGTAVTGTLDTWLNLGTTRTWTLASGSIDVTNTAVLDVSIRDAATLTVVDTATFTLQCTYATYVPPTCFPAGSKVLMADGTWNLIENVKAGDMVMGMGQPEPIIEVDRPILGPRRMMGFADGSLRWSEEHAMWTRDAAQTQWWWSANPDMWQREVRLGAIGGLYDNSTMRSGADAAEWAHISGWKTNTYSSISPAVDPNTRLYLPRTNGSPIIVNGYVVGAGVNQAGFDYAVLDWNVIFPQLTVVQPL